jgi:hypothetical protein
VSVYRPGPRARGLHICGKPELPSIDRVSLSTVTPRGWVGDCSTCTLALGWIVMARDVVALSRSNGSKRLVAISPCGSRMEGSEIAWGMSSFGAAELRSPLRLSGLVATLERRLDGPSTRGLG